MRHGKPAPKLKLLLIALGSACMLATLLTVSGCAATSDSIEYAADAPPASRAEVKPDQPGPRYVWHPGNWAWRAGPRRYEWKPGRWKPLRHPHHHHWVAGSWNQTERGWRWVAGHWR
ncbi:MAG: hypothetical protein ACI9WU_004479 [Myxococcota bacterium]|jgi:hypothetical protein